MHEELRKLKPGYSIQDALREADKALESAGYAHDGFMRAGVHDAIQALTAPQAKTCERDAVLDEIDMAIWLEIMRVDIPHKAGMHHALKIVRSMRKSNIVTCPWTRKDGSTTPRGDVVDRRKSKWGDIGVAKRRGGEWGRRAGDAVRWSADRSRWVQETPQTFTEAHRQWVLGNRFPGVGCPTSFEQWICAELDRRSVK